MGALQVGGMVWLACSDVRVPRTGEMYLDKSGRVQVCKERRHSTNAQHRPILHIRAIVSPDGKTCTQ